MPELDKPILPDFEVLPEGERKRLKLERKIKRRIRQFDLVALLTQLRRAGYEREDIYFQSSRDLASSASLIEDIEFRRDGLRRVELYLNLGLLGSNSLLPSYFLKTAEELPESEIFYDFVKFFDHQLISNFIHNIFPEGEGHLFRNWADIRRSYLRMLGLGSVSTLNWLFAYYFPELGVRVQRSAYSNTTRNHAFQTGFSALDGTGVIGRQYAYKGSGLAVNLIADEEFRDDGTSWAHYVQERIETKLGGLLAPIKEQMWVVLSVKEHSSWAKLLKDGFLGYERLQTPGQSGHQLVIWPSRFHS